jgi:multicomponent Na+:H+ antiporter subunit B
VLAADPPTAQHIGILLVELGVGVTVAATMIMLFYAFGSRD